jgi:hypothetical protein
MHPAGIQVTSGQARKFLHSKESKFSHRVELGVLFEIPNVLFHFGKKPREDSVLNLTHNHLSTQSRRFISTVRETKDLGLIPGA